MLGNTFSEYFPEWYEREGYNFLPGDKVEIQTNGNKRPGEIYGGYPSSFKGIICYSGRYTDNGGGFIEIPETQIILIERNIIY